MGSLFYTLDEAAVRLNRSKRQIHNYCTQGFLTKKLINGKVFVQKEDVDQLVVELDTDAPSLNRKTFLRMLNRVDKLEMQMSVFSKLIGAKDYLRPDPSSAAALYDLAKDHLARSDFQLGEVELWVEQLSRIDEVALSQFSEAVPLGKPWLTFYKLNIHLMKYISQRDTFSTNLQLQKLHAELNLCRSELRKAILSWVMVNEDSPLKAVTMMFNDLETPKEALFSSILEKVPKKPE